MDDQLHNLVAQIEGMNLLDEFRSISNADNPAYNKDVLHYAFEHKPIHIIPLSDAHVGSIICNMDKFKSVIDFIAAHDDIYTILLGDLAETATPSSIGAGMFDEHMHVEDQIDCICGLLEPINKKILASIIGNHETRIRNLAGIDIVKIIASRLHIPYCGYSSYLSLDVGQVNYTIAAYHGHGRGTSVAGKIKSSEQLKDNVLVDIFLSGHVHYRSYHDDFIDIIENNHVKKFKRHYVSCGSYLEYVGGYGEMSGYSLPVTGTVMLTLNPDIKDVRITF